MNALTRLFLGCAAMLLSLGLHASTDAAEQLRQAMFAKDIDSFGQILNSGSINPEAFSIEPSLYEIACASTFEGYTEFFDRLLEFGLDASTEDPTRNPNRFSLLVCSVRQFNLESFSKLLDAGARTDIVLCEKCAPAAQQTLVERVLGIPEMFLEIAARRDLTDAELVRVAARISKRYYHVTLNGQPLNEFYADYLRERGVDVTPRGRNG